LPVRRAHAKLLLERSPPAGRSPSRPHSLSITLLIVQLFYLSFEAGKALAELRDRRLYRSTHKTFEQYCKDRFGYTRIAASYKIAAATVMENLLTTSTINSKV
jgi:hypothetical protein